MSEQIITPEFRVSFPAVFEAKHNDMSGQNEFSVQALFPKGADLSKLKVAAKAAIVKKWGPDEKKWPRREGKIAIRMPFRDQGDREKTREDGTTYLPEGYEKGSIYMNLKSTRRPGVVDQNVQPILDAETFYAGCYARAYISCYPYEKKGNCGVSFGLNHLQKTREGEALSGRRKAEEVFESIVAPDESGNADVSDVNDLF